MIELERMSFIAQPIAKTFKPFEKWVGSDLKNFEVTLRIITVGDQIEIGRALVNEPATSLLDVHRVQLLAKAIVAINGRPVVSDEELDEYRHEHKTSDDFSRHDFIVIYLRKLTTVVRDTIYFSYDELQNLYTAQLLGAKLPDDLKLGDQEKPSSDTTDPGFASKVGKNDQNTNSDDKTGN